MKKLIATLTVIGLYCSFGGKKADAWFNTTHEYITENALELLKKEGKTKIYKFYEPYTRDLILGSIQPDKVYDIDYGTGTHYYSCVNNKCKPVKDKNGYYANRLGKYSKSARTMLEENYTSALSLYKSGKKQEAINVLGRAIHFVSDLSCTAHTANMRYLDKPTNVHYTYEKHANTLCRQYTADKYDKRLNKAYDSDSFENAVHKLISNTSRYASSLARLDPTSFDAASRATIPLAQQNAAALLFKFYQECSADKGNFLLDNKAYTIRNEFSGQVITVTDKDLELNAINKELEQKLILKIGENGAFGLRTKDGKFVNETCKGYTELENDETPALFRFAALGKRRFRITVGATGFEKVLGCSKIGSLTITDFIPGDNSQIWIIN